jgi:magnesium transporter
MGAVKKIRGLAKYLPEWTWNYSKRKPITRYNPNASKDRPKTFEPVYTIYQYNINSFEERKLTYDEACMASTKADAVTWLNVDGLYKEQVEKIGSCYKIHHLVLEDILSIGQRAKMDDTGEVIYCLLPMLYYNEGTGEIETEQVSIVLGRNFVISFQEDPERDVFDPVRDKLRNKQQRLRSGAADYLCYSLIDVIVDSYFNIIEKMNERIERLEDALMLQRERGALEKISILRREIMVMRRSIFPVRDLVQSFLRSESDLLEERHDKYYKDVLDHITQANEYVENHRDMLMNLQDLSMSQINLRMNEVMKVFTLLATLMAPATVIGGIFGMNFDVIPLAHQERGFYITVGVMLFVPLLMLIYFKRKGWF